MGIRTAAQYIESLKDNRRLFIDGQLVTDVTAYEPLKRVIDSVAATFEMQHDPVYHDTVTYVSPSSGERVSTTYLPAVSYAEFQQRQRCDHARTDFTYGMMGRLTDFMSAFLLDQEISLRAGGYADAADRTQAYIDRCREEDLCITHALIDPQSDRSRVDAPEEATRIVERRPDGVVVSGARLLSTLAPIANECYVGPFYPRQPGEEDFALVFSMPMNAEGLKIVARESYDKGRSLFDRPLSGRFDEGDAILVFDNVFIPDERIMIAGDVAAYNSLIGRAPGYTTIQASARSTAKLRFITGLCEATAQANGRAKTPRFQEMIGELVATVQIAEGLQKGACVEAAEIMQMVAAGDTPPPTPSPGESTLPGASGFAALTVFFPRANTEALEVLKSVVGSGGITMTEADYENPELKPLIDRLLIGPGIDAKHRLQLLKLAWDMTSEPFGSRQHLYEKYYSGDPIRNRINWYKHPKRLECQALVNRLLDW
ncbi:MAG: 4-hydroxyphenylacetate 3-hydroxylase [Gammaproteobacteria bacterium]|nr:MAG: 4-hydroxyphenylacetate 3-hydroxylase [Gammaproteobacteria bacterium]RLA10910.1 MAG: 4-hydroxyphenylacetate 3-hydroxylase [Gammaproteobacteria bacterium]